MNRRSLVLGGAALLLGGGKALAFGGRSVVEIDTPERPGTLIVNTGEKALFRILGEGLAMRYPVAVGRDGRDWAGIATVGRKVMWPAWTPPAAMIARKPELAKWAGGMPGGPDNPLGARSLSLREWPRHPVPGARHQRAGVDRARGLVRVHPHAQRAY